MLDANKQKSIKFYFLFKFQGAEKYVKRIYNENKSNSFFFFYFRCFTVYISAIRRMKERMKKRKTEVAVMMMSIVADAVQVKAKETGVKVREKVRVARVTERKPKVAMVKKTNTTECVFAYVCVHLNHIKIILCCSCWIWISDLFPLKAVFIIVWREKNKKFKLQKRISTN